MNRKEAMRALIEGKKITLRYWDEDSFLHMPEDCILDEKGMDYFYRLAQDPTWELYIEPKKKVIKWLWASATGKDPREGTKLRILQRYCTGNISYIPSTVLGHVSNSVCAGGPGYTWEFFTEKEHPEEYPVKLEYTATEFEE